MTIAARHYQYFSSVAQLEDAYIGQYYFSATTTISIITSYFMLATSVTAPYDLDYLSTTITSQSITVNFVIARSYTPI